MRAKVTVLIASFLTGILALSMSCQQAGEQKSTAQITPAAAVRQVINFNKDWKFKKGDPNGAESPIFDDSSWQAVRLPHDWAITGPFNPNEDGYAGKLPWYGVGWYRKTFKLDDSAAGHRVYFDFDGVMAFPKVYINGQLAGGWDYGYMSFRVDATPFVKLGQDNVIAVRADTRNHGTRWYPGAGIYRKVTMTITDAVHIAQWGTYITTPKVADDSATIKIVTTLENHRMTKSKVNLEIELIDPDGKTAATVNTGSDTLSPGQTKDIVIPSVMIGRPQRWDVNSPKLYTAKTIVRMDDKVVDNDMTTFGVRQFEFTANDGFHLNGRRVQLYGVCLHHDQGALGAAFNTRAMQRQLEIMKDMGVNALRTSHNPPAPDVLELCDRMGIVVWDEVFDKWDRTADRVNDQPPLEQYGEKQIRNFVMRDRNHPCIVVWSTGNEIQSIPVDKQGLTPERVKFMCDFFHKYDLTRPAGMACCFPNQVAQSVFDSLDLAGWNYQRRYAQYRKKYPDKPIIYSESASAFSTRGFYEVPIPTAKTQYSKEFQVSSYDRNAATWADIPDLEFNLMEKDKFVAGEFVWTGFDYIGEPTPFSRVARSSYFGIVDLAGIPKDRFYLYRSYWRPDVTTVHILPHWNWPEQVGKNVPVYVYTNGDTAELFLNGVSLGKRSKATEISSPVNFAKGKPAKVSSEQSDQGNTADKANDDTTTSRWCAADANSNQWWQVDLGGVQEVRYLTVDFEKDANNYQYQIKSSIDGSVWQTVADKNDWSGDNTINAWSIDSKPRFLRVEFTNLQPGAWASIREFGAYTTKTDPSYYAVTDKYRIRFNDVIYQPGELKAVAYKAGKEIGSAVMRTAGNPVTVRLFPDRKILAATGDDLCYCLIEAVDANGTVCPLADNLIRFKIDGPAEIAGVDNGNPLSYEPFHADYRKLFFGKAMLILRTKEGQPGDIKIIAESDGLTSAEATVQSK